MTNSTIGRLPLTGCIGSFIRMESRFGTVRESGGSPPDRHIRHLNIRACFGAFCNETTETAQAIDKKVFVYILETA
jgi:hypothetical protein